MGLGSAGQVDVAFIGDSEQITWAAVYGPPQPGDEQMIDVTAVSLVAAALDVPPEAATDVLREELWSRRSAGRDSPRLCHTWRRRADGDDRRWNVRPLRRTVALKTASAKPRGEGEDAIFLCNAGSGAERHARLLT